LVGVEKERSFPQDVSDVTAGEYAYQPPVRSDDPDSAQDAMSKPTSGADEPRRERAGKSGAWSGGSGPHPIDASHRNTGLLL